MILARILWLIGFAGSMLMTVGGIKVYRESRQDQSVTWAFSEKALLTAYIVIDILSALVLIRDLLR